MTRVKICGLTRTEDVAAAINAGAEMLGFIHVPGSPRFVDRSHLGRLLEEVGGRAETVIVVRDAARSLLRELRAEFNFDFFQFHGAEPPEIVRDYQGYKVIHIKGEVPDMEDVRSYGEPYLLDTQVGSQQGGTGVPFDWEIIPRFQGRFLVAGGLNPENVKQLVQRFHPWGVDVSSGVEASVGCKDHNKLRAFLNRVQEA